MADFPAFLDIPRRQTAYRPVRERAGDYRDVALLRPLADSRRQASRCLDCGLPFCHWSCPLGNYVPSWNQYAARGEWQKAFWALQATNNMPEITGRLCPALCEASCVLNLTDEAITNRENELAIIEQAFQRGWVEPRPPARRTGRAVAVVGSGPAGLACAAQLNSAGHQVVVFERDDQLGGLLRYGIPDFKLEKWILDRRVQVWKDEGVEFVTEAHVGVTHPAAKLLKAFHAVCLAGGSRAPRDLAIEGRPLKGIHFALEYLIQSNRRVAGEAIPPEQLIDARGKRIVVIGGGDTGADCVGTAVRQGARRVTQIEVLPQPPERRASTDLWPDFPRVLKTSSSHEEGCERRWSVLTQRFLGANGRVQKLACATAEPARQPDGQTVMRAMPGTEFELDADLVLLALGFVSPERPGMLEQLGVAVDARGNVATDETQATSFARVFSAGDMRRGQSLVVWALAEGRKTAHFIDRFLMGCSTLAYL